jgi:bla regulator protein blaR1
MSSQSQERIAYARALASGLIVPILLIAAFLASARATYSPAPMPTKVVQPTTPSPIAEKTQTVSTMHVPSPMLALATSGDAYGFSDDGADHVYWALVEGGERKGSQTIGSTDDRARRMISRARRGESGQFLYLRIDSRDYIVRDSKILMAAREIVEPVQVLGRKMGELGGRQGLLGARQGVLGSQQARLGIQQAELGARQAELAMKAQSRERRGLSTTELEQERREIDDAMREFSRQQSELGRRQSELGERQSALGQEQSRYGEQMSRASREVEKQMRELGRKAIRSGEATEIVDTDA